MNKKVSLSYACPIPWEEMKSINDKERFCSQCQTNVRDFTKDQLPDTSDIKCGRFRTDQLESVKRTFNFSGRQVATISMMALLGLAPLAGFSQTEVEQLPTKSTDVLAKGHFVLSGTIKDSASGKSIPYANVEARYCNGRVLGSTTSDLYGAFSLKVSAADFALGDIIFEITSAGYSSKTIKDDNLEKGAGTQLKVVLQPAIDRSSLEEQAVRSYITGLIIAPMEDSFDEENMKNRDRSSPYTPPR